MQNVSFTRDRLVESFLWSIGVAYERHYSCLRKCLAKVVTFVLVIDDLCDVYGSLEELECFTRAIVRWDYEEIQHLPDCIKTCFWALNDTANEIARDIEKESGYNGALPYLKKVEVNAELIKVWKEMENLVYYTSLIIKFCNDLGTSKIYLSISLMEKGNFRRRISGNSKGVLELFKASYLASEGENILAMARAFLYKNLKDKLSYLDDHLAKQTSFTLELPLHWRVHWFKVRGKIDAYARGVDNTPLLLESIGVAYKPYYSCLRKCLAKVVSFVLVIDDPYNVYGSLEELECITRATVSFFFNAIAKDGAQLPVAGAKTRDGRKFK
ncbi:hypothetical protein Ancab_033672 [Ancistrocladus abbreviatus]